MAEPGRIKSGSNIKARRIASKCRAVGSGGQGVIAQPLPQILVDQLTQGPLITDGRNSCNLVNKGNKGQIF